MPDLSNQENKEATEAKLQRINEVVLLLLDNRYYLKSKRNKELTEKVVAVCECSPRQANRYIKAARQELLKIGHEKREEMFVQSVQDLTYMFETHKNSGKPNVALRAVIERARLFGLIVENVNINTEGIRPDLSGLSIEELKNLAQSK